MCLNSTGFEEYNYHDQLPHCLVSNHASLRADIIMSNGASNPQAGYERIRERTGN
jgi:hypothetical protein